MAIPRALPATTGVLTLLATSAILILHIILAGCIRDSRAVRVAASVSAALEGVSLSVLAWLVSTYVFVSTPDRSKRFLGAAFAVSVFTCALASVSSIVAMVLLGNAARGPSDRVLGAEQEDFLIGASVTLGVAFMSQVAFIVVHFVFTRVNGGGGSIFTIETPVHAEVKSIPYDRTKPRGDKELDLLSPPGSSSGKSATDTISSFRRSVSSVARPLSARTVLTRARSSSSLTSNLCREGAIPEDPEDPFDAWDASGDAHARPALHRSTSRLQTIPASPTLSPTPSLDDDVPLEPPRVSRSRSFSPVPRGQYATGSDGSEANIHPLFRSDSPTPPMATPGTVVMASPNAGQVISDRGSLRAGRMRSGSLNAPSPLSRRGSVDEFTPVRPAVREGEWGRGTPEGSILETPEEEGERGFTPPIPEWVLSAGSRSSLVDYNRRTGTEGS